MPRKKYDNPEDVLTHPIVLRVTKTEFERLEKLAAESNCRTIGEVARKILSNEKILLFHRDISMNGPMEELSRRITLTISRRRSDRSWDDQ